MNVRYDDENGRPVYRPYSPVNQPGTNRLVLAVKRYDDGICSAWLHERDVGDPVSLMPPSGNLSLRDLDRDVAFLSTGTGLIPLIAMLSLYLGEAHIYVCGVPEMVVTVQSALQERGIPPDRIFSEGWEEGAVSK